MARLQNYSAQRGKKTERRIIVCSVNFDKLKWNCDEWLKCNSTAELRSVRLIRLAAPDKNAERRGGTEQSLCALINWPYLVAFIPGRIDATLANVDYTLIAGP